MTEFIFEESPWEQAIAAMEPGTAMSALQLLALLQGEDEDAWEAAFQMLSQKNISLELSDLPAFTANAESAQRLQLEKSWVENGGKVESLEENDPLRLYLEELADTPAGATEQEAFASKMLPVVVEEAKLFVGRGVLLLDLIQEGSLGLWQGILEGDEADCRAEIRRAIAKAVILQARDTGVGQKLQEAMEDYRDVDQQLLIELGRNPTLEEIAERLHLTPQQAEMVAAMVENARSLQQVKAPRPEPEEEEDQAVENTAYFQSRQAVAEMLAQLTSEEAKLLSLRFGLEGGLPLDVQKTGRALGLTPEQVVEMEAAALNKLRKQ